jgi:hypothetical protein
VPAAYRQVVIEVTGTPCEIGKTAAPRGVRAQRDQVSGDAGKDQRAARLRAVQHRNELPVTQVANIVRGVHALIPQAIFAADLRREMTMYERLACARERYSTEQPRRSYCLADREGRQAGRYRSDLVMPTL